MWQGREIVLCTLAFLAGNLLGGTLTLAPVVYLGLAVLFSVVAAVCVGRPDRGGHLAGCAGRPVGGCQAGASVAETSSDPARRVSDMAAFGNPTVRITDTAALENPASPICLIPPVIGSAAVPDLATHKRQVPVTDPATLPDLFAPIRQAPVSWTSLMSLPLLLLCFVLLGAAGVQVGRMPSFDGGSALQMWCLDRKAAFSAWLSGIVPGGDELGVLRALAIGDKGSLSRDLKEAYRESGAMHLLALSGLHVGLLYALMLRMLSPLRGFRPARVLRSLLVLSALWTYALITGFSASIARAVLMITFYEVSGFISGDRDAMSALAGSAFLLTLFHPEAPRDIGFQLSYSAVLSILLFHPHLSGLLQTRSRLLARIWELLSVSICCQSTCGVLAWIYFGSFPRYFLLTTLLAIPLATAVMYAIAAAVGVSALSGLLAGLLPSSATLSTAVSGLLHWLLHLLNTVIRLIASL